MIGQAKSISIGTEIASVELGMPIEKQQSNNPIKHAVDDSLFDIGMEVRRAISTSLHNVNVANSFVEHKSIRIGDVRSVVLKVGMALAALSSSLNADYPGRTQEQSQRQLQVERQIIKQMQVAANPVEEYQRLVPGGRYHIGESVSINNLGLIGQHLCKDVTVTPCKDYFLVSFDFYCGPDDKRRINRADGHHINIEQGASPVIINLERYPQLFDSREKLVNFVVHSNSFSIEALSNLKTKTRVVFNREDGGSVLYRSDGPVDKYALSNSKADYAHGFASGVIAGKMQDSYKTEAKVFRNGVDEAMEDMQDRIERMVSSGDPRVIDFSIKCMGNRDKDVSRLGFSAANAILESATVKSTEGNKKLYEGLNSNHNAERLYEKMSEAAHMYGNELRDPLILRAKDMWSDYASVAGRRDLGNFTDLDGQDYGFRQLDRIATVYKNGEMFITHRDVDKLITEASVYLEDSSPTIRLEAKNVIRNIKESEIIREKTHFKYREEGHAYRGEPLEHKRKVRKSVFNNAE